MRSGDRVDPAALRALQRGENDDPHAVLGPHSTAQGWIVRAFHPDAVGACCRLEGGAEVTMTQTVEGVFVARLRGAERPRYRLCFSFSDGNTWELVDPYSFAPSLESADLVGFATGTHRRLDRVLGAHCCHHGGFSGTRFSVWAPRALAVRLIGDFCGWQGKLLPMRRLSHGVFELFVPGVTAGACYKYEIVTASEALRTKCDPVGFAFRASPDPASRVVDSRFEWRDADWLARRSAGDPRRQPLAIYEVHLGSWDRDGGEMLSYRQLAPRLVAHVKRLGFTHLELMPVAEHAFYASWGYQVTGFFAPTWRHGEPDDLRWFVDYCHRAGLGVLVDWVPAHFPRDDWALRRFDGEPLYETDDRGHDEWGTLLFDHGRPEVCSFLLSNALYWLREFHFDGLRVDAVSWTLYRNYLEGDEASWQTDEAGAAFLRAVSTAVADEAPGAMTVAEEATAWPGVTADVAAGGLGFTFKWNMGWMNDTLRYFALDPIYRKAEHQTLTFAMTYEHNECFVNPLSHDEVVHLKKSLLGKMPGDEEQRFANLRLLLTYQFTRPGKKLAFMGTELAPDDEWNHDAALPWLTGTEPRRRAFCAFVTDLVRLYRDTPCLWRDDPDPAGFCWIDASDRDSGVVSYVRWAGEDHLVVVLSLTPVARPQYRIGVPGDGAYRIALDTGATRYGAGSDADDGAETEVDAETDIEVEDEAFLGWQHSVQLDLPPLGALLLVPSEVEVVQPPPPGAVPGLPAD